MERTFAWLGHQHRLLVRHERLLEVYHAFLTIACTVLASSFGCYQLRLPVDAWLDLEAAAKGLDRAKGALRSGNPRQAWGWAQVAYHTRKQREIREGQVRMEAYRARLERVRALRTRQEHLLSVVFWRQPRKGRGGMFTLPPPT